MRRTTDSAELQLTAELSTAAASLASVAGRVVHLTTTAHVSQTHSRSTTYRELAQSRLRSLQMLNLVVHALKQSSDFESMLISRNNKLQKSKDQK